MRVRKITCILNGVVAIRPRWLRELCRRLDVEVPKPAVRCAGIWMFTYAAWEDFLAASKPASQGSGDECDEFCSQACENDEGCQFSAGEPPECVGVCNNCEVFLQT